MSDAARRRPDRRHRLWQVRRGKIFGELGADVIDTDAIAHALTAAGGAAIPAIPRQFGDGFIGVDGSLDRVPMRKHVFVRPDARQMLESSCTP